MCAGFHVFCEKYPKGFEKYFKQSGAAKSRLENTAKQNDENKKADEIPKTPNSTQQSKNPNDWNLGMFKPSSQNQKNQGTSGGGGGRPIGNENPEKEKWLIFGAIGTVAFIAILAYFEMGYKEIGWKEFLNK